MGKFKFKLLSMFLSLAVLFSPTAVFAEKEIIDVRREEVICKRYLSDVLIITTLPEYSLKMPDYERFGLRRPWWDYRNAIKEIRLDMFKSMNYRTFRDFRRLEIADLSKATELEDLGQETFLRCDKLAFLFLPETFKEKFYSINGKVASEEECRKYYAINDNCQIKFSDWQSYNKELTDKVENLEKENLGSKSAVEKVESLEQENKSLKEKISFLKQNNIETKGKIEKLEKELKVSREKNIAAQKENQNSKYTISGLEQKNKKLENIMLILKQRDAKTKDKIEKLEKELETLTNKFTEQEKQLKVAQERNIALQKEGSASKSVATGLEQENKRLQEEISVLRQKDIENSKRIEKLENAIKEIEKLYLQ